MKEPHHQRKVGIGMIMVAASLALIGMLQLFIGPDVLRNVGKIRMWKAMNAGNTERG